MCTAALTAWIVRSPTRIMQGWRISSNNWNTRVYARLVIRATPKNRGNKRLEKRRGVTDIDWILYRTILLETFKQSGEAVNTPIWFVADGETLYIATGQEAYKVKRLRRDPRARVAGADAAENPATEWIDMRAHVVEDESEKARIFDLLNRRYDNAWSEEERAVAVVIGLDRT